MKLSLIIPFYNRSNSFPRLVKSIASQNLLNWEVLVCDDASSENVDVVKDICAKHGFKYLRLDENKGPAGTRNAGVASASGDYVVFLDSDDFLMEEFFSMYEKNLNDSSSEIGWCGIWEQGKEDSKKHVWLFDQKQLLPDIVMKGIRVGTNCGFYCRKDFFYKVGGFDENLRHAEDTDFIIRAAYLQPSLNVIDTTLIVVDKAGQNRVTQNFTEKAKAYEIIIAKNATYLNVHPSIAQQFEYKLGWSYMHSREDKMALIYFKKVLSKGWHTHSFILLLSCKVFGSLAAARIHFLLSALSKII